MPQRRRRQARYPARISVQMSEAMEQAIEAEADRLDLDASELVRRILTEGLPQPDATRSQGDPAP